MNIYDHVTNLDIINIYDSLFKHHRHLMIYDYIDGFDIIDIYDLTTDLDIIDISDEEDNTKKEKKCTKCDSIHSETERCHFVIGGAKNRRVAKNHPIQTLFFFIRIRIRPPDTDSGA